MYHLIFIVKIKNNMRVCIYGSGLSSLSLAHALVNQKIYVDLITTNNFLNAGKTRTLGISRSNVLFFNKNIVNIEKLIWKLNKIEIFTENLKNDKVINFEDNSEYLFSIIKNYKLLELLKKSLFKNKYFKIIKFKKKIFFENYNLVINTENNNFITKKYFSKKIVKKYNSLAYTTVIKHKEISNHVATQIFTKKGPLAFLPISKNQTSVVYSVHNQVKKEDNDICDLIHYYNFKYKISKIEKIESFRLNALSLRSYHYNNILAFGDLLHRVHPLAGQGFNMTIRDIMYLTKIIKEKKNLGLPLDKTVCNEFEKNYRHKNYIYSSGIHLIHDFFNFERKIPNNVLSKSLKLLGQNHLINKFFTKIADKGIIF